MAMVQKDYQIDVTPHKFHQHSLFLLHETTVILSTETSTLTADHQPSMDHKTFIARGTKMETICGLRIMDVVKQRDHNQQSAKQDQQYLLLSSIDQDECKKSRNFSFPNSKMILVDKDAGQGKFLCPKLTVHRNPLRNQLFSRCLKWQSKNHYDRKCKGLTQNKPLDGQSVILDLSDSPQYLIQEFIVLNKQQLLLHLGPQEQPHSSICLGKFDLNSETVTWRHRSSRFEKFMSLSLPFSENSFVSPSQDLQSNVSSLNLFDFRVKGTVLKVLRSNSQCIQRLSINRNIDTKFGLTVQADRAMTMLSILSWAAGAKGSPYLLDVRRPDELEMIHMADDSYFSHLKGILYSERKIFAIQREYSSYRLLKTKLTKYLVAS